MQKSYVGNIIINICTQRKSSSVSQLSIIYEVEDLREGKKGKMQEEHFSSSTFDCSRFTMQFEGKLRCLDIHIFSVNFHPFVQ